MKALTLYQPWATLIAVGAKSIETRSWATSYRGPIAIHASKNDEYAPLRDEEPYRSALLRAGLPSRVYDGVECVVRRAIPLGVIVAVAELTHCIPSTGFSSVSEVLKLPRWPVPGKVFMACDAEWQFGDLGPGRFGWALSNVKRLAEPIPCRGAQGLWDVPADVEARIRAQTEASSCRF